MTTSEVPAVRVSKAATVTGWVLGILPAALMMMSATFKLIHAPEGREGFEGLGWSYDAATAMGILEMACAVIYLIPRTAVLGAILMTGYLGGACATHFRIGQAVGLAPVTAGVVAWLGLYLREPRLRVLAPWRMPAGWVSDGKKHVLWKIAIIAVVVIAALLVTIGIMPADFAVSRSDVMEAPAAAVFEQVNDFHRWEAWDPWAKIDPNAKTTFDGPVTGVGSKMSWSGNSEVGEGSATIVESVPGERVKVRLDFRKPMEATNIAEFVFAERAGKTTVTWTMTGRKNFMMKAFCMMMNMDQMVGGDFEKGLRSMKQVVEKQGPATRGRE